MIWEIWLLVPVLYCVFAIRYFNWRGPIRSAEVETFMQQFSAAEGSQHTDEAVFRRFLEEDDGQEFVMMNLVQLHEGAVSHPVSGQQMPAATLLKDYFRPFAWALLKRGGHPVFQARAVGGFIDSWNAEGNRAFKVAAMMRYRSRRDLVELVVDPAFAQAHIHKLAAIERTLSYPTRILFSVWLRPPAVVLLGLVLLASVAQNLVFLLQSG